MPHINQNETVLVIGGNGFIGINIAEALLPQGFDVVIYARHPLKEEVRRELSSLKGNLLFVQGDVLDAEKLEKTVVEYGISHVVYGAAITPNRELEMSHAKDILEINCIGLLNALNAARKNEFVRRFIYLGSISAYGTTALQQDPLIEGVSLAQPKSLYEISKFTGERLVLRYRELFNMQAVVARIGDVFGPWEHYSGVRSFMSMPYQTTVSAMRGDTVYLAYPYHVDWVYGADIAGATLSLLAQEHLHYDIYPFCAGKQFSIMDWCGLLKERYPAFQYALASAEHPATLRVNQDTDNAPMSLKRLTEDTGYAPRYQDIQDSFNAYMEWLDRHPGYIAEI